MNAIENLARRYKLLLAALIAGMMVLAGPAAAAIGAAQCVAHASADVEGRWGPGADVYGIYAGNERGR